MDSSHWISRMKSSKPFISDPLAQGDEGEEGQERDALGFGVRGEEVGQEHGLVFLSFTLSNVGEGKQTKRQETLQFDPPITTCPQQRRQLGRRPMNHLLRLVGVDCVESLVDYQIHAIDAIHSPADTDRRHRVVGVTAVPPSVGWNLTGSHEMDEPLLAAEFRGQLVGVGLSSSLAPCHRRI
jgi:hypothetical protein